MAKRTKRSEKPTLVDLHSYEFEKTRKGICEVCNKRTTQEVYAGLDFADGSSLLFCRGCKSRILI